MPAKPAVSDVVKRRWWKSATSTNGAIASSRCWSLTMAVQRKTQSRGSTKTTPRSARTDVLTGCGRTSGKQTNARNAVAKLSPEILLDLDQT